MPDSRDAKLREILDVLGRLGPRAEWSVLSRESAQWQVFHVRSEMEAFREAEDLAFEIEIHHHHDSPSGPSMGTARFEVLLSDSRPGIEAAAARSLYAAERIHSRPWFVQAPGLEYPPVEAFARDEASAPRETLEAAAAEILDAAAREKGIDPSHFEIVFTDATLGLVNSKGLSLEGRTTSAVLHLVLVGSGGGARFDIKRELYRRRAGDFGLARAVAEASALARDTLRAGLPASGTFPVVMSHSGLEFLFSPIIAHAGGEYHFEKLSRFRAGRPILDGDAAGDRLTLASDSTLPMGVLTAPFTSEGLPAIRIEVVRDNVFENVVASSEFSHALGIRATGPFANAVIEPGSTPMSAMTSGGRLLHVVEFSAMLPDRMTGDFTAEVRLGYEIDGGARRPVKGGAVSGNLFDAMRSMTLSRETDFRGDYFGPAAARFEDLTVSGA